LETRPSTVGFWFFSPSSAFAHHVGELTGAAASRRETSLDGVERRRRGFPVSTDSTFPLIFQTFTRGSNSQTADGGLVITMIIRARHDKDDPYFRLRRATAQDVQLSWAARGVITYLFSKPDNWEVRVEDLVDKGNLGRDAIYKILAELQRLGYIHRRKERQSNGTIGRWVMDVYETPHAEFPEVDGSPLPGLPDLAEPDLVQPDLVNQEHRYKREVQIREFKKEQKQQHAAAAASVGTAKTESFAGRFPLDQIEAFIRATKSHKTEGQIGGLARHLQRTGEEDEQIAEWLARRAQTSALSEHSPECRLCQGTGWQVISGKGARPCPNLSIEQNSP
jgi:hypothetical protein